MHNSYYTSFSAHLLSSSESTLSSTAFASIPVHGSNSSTCNSNEPDLFCTHGDDRTSAKSLSILYYNARSILPKINELQLLTSLHKPTLICIVESWLSCEITDQELGIDGYQIVRLDRNRHGGGVMFYVSEDFQFSVLPACPGLELLSLIIQENNSKCCVSLFYRPPNSPSNILTTLSAYLESIDTSALSNFILVGDFNVDISNPSHPLRDALDDLSHSFHLQQMVTEPTHIHNHGASIIDLVFTSNSLLIRSCTVIPPLSNSDHNGLLTRLLWRSSSSHNCPNHSKGRTVWLYRHADWAKAGDLIEDVDWESLLDDNIDISWSNWHNKFISIMEECIPKKRLPNRKNLPWLNRKLVTSMKKRNLLYRRAKRTGDFSKYRAARNKVTRDMRKAKSTFFKKLNPKNPKEFWRAVKFLNKKQSSIPTLSDDSREASTGSEKANLLNDYFSKCFNSAVPPLSNVDVETLPQPTDYASLPPELLCNEESICELLESLDTSKSNGPDGISARMLKHTAAFIAPSITQLFNQSLQSCKVPSKWKSSLVVPVPKGSNCHSPSNYRPISLLVVLSKILEKHVHSIITQHLNVHHPISNSQWGFTAGRSTIGALLSTTHDWFKLLEEGKDICAVFLDYRKAFDSVPHRPLIEKLKGVGLNPHIIAWLSDYLTSRKQRVVVDGSISSSTEVLSGVPQGSILGPLLFLIYIDGITKVKLSNNSRLVLYADDVLIYSAISDNNDYQLLQRDINAICDWSTEQYLTLNPQKCKSMTISRKMKPSTAPFTLRLHNKQLEEVDQFKYLGVILNHNLSWSPHISAICTKAKRS